MRRMGFIGMIAILLLLLAVLPAAAHKVSVFGYVEDGKVLGEGYFAGGVKAKGCRVELVDSAGKVLAKTSTDQQGRFSLELPPKAKAPLKLVLTASMGHKGEYLLTAEDLDQAGAAPAGGGEQEAAAPAPAPAAAPGPVAAASSKEIQAAVERALDKKLAPLTAQVAKLAAERGVSLPDIIGGIGYILGLLGLAAYLKSRGRA